MSQFAIKKSNETRITQLIVSYCKAQNGLLAFSQVMQILLAQGILTHSVSFKTIYDKFIEAHQLPRPLVKKVSVKSPEQQKPNVATQKTLTREQFVYFLNQMGKYIYHSSKKTNQLLFNQFLIDRNELPAEQRVRTPILDDNTKKVITEQAILELIKYEDDLIGLYNCYIWENYQLAKNKNRILLQPEDIKFANKRMNSVGLILFLKQSQICSNHIGIQHIQELLRSIIPSVSQKQQHFYYRKFLTELYNDDISKRNKPLTDPNDPGLNFLQFQLIMMRIGWDSYPKQLEKKGVELVLRRFFDKLGLRSDLKKQLTTNKKHLVLLDNYYKKYVGKQYKSPNFQQVQSQKKLQLEDRFKQELFGQEPNFDIFEIYKSLDRALPKMPQLLIPKKQCLPPFDEAHPPKRINIGQQAPPQQKQQIKQKPKQIKKEPKQNKDQEPPRIFQWAPVPQQILSTQDYLKQLHRKLSLQIKPLSSLSRGAVNIQTIPSIISETAFPTELPKDAQASLMSFKSSLVDRNFVLALQSLQSAFVGWKKYLSRNSVEMTPQAQLFFQYSKGSIFCSAGKYGRALSYFINCRKIAEGGKMNFTNPDRSLPYMGLGQIFYQIQQYQLAARSYLKARQIRQSILKLQHVQTATVFCNLGACFFMLRRNTQALGYTEIAQNILSSELGAYHERTITARLNLKKVRRGQFDNHPQFRTPWQVFQKDEFEGGSKKKKKVQKKK